MKTHVMLDRETGLLWTVGRDGERYSAAQVSRAQWRAKRGDADARALLANIDRSHDFMDMSPQAMMDQLVHECPECRAAMARGEVAGPAVTGEALLRELRPPPKKLRWREQRRARGR